MSDFDKEAERERLREKYEQDRQKRAATEEMSELLLQGATMTNAHCSDCGDPIFRYEGQEFCATCEKSVDRNGADGDSEGEDGAADGSVEVTSPDESQVVFGKEGAEKADAQQHQAGAGAAEPAHQQAEKSGPESQHQGANRSVDAAGQSTGESQPRAPQHGEAAKPTGQATGEFETAHDALLATLVRFSQQAAATEDPRQAKAHLEAAREAAEALAVLRG